MIYCMGVSGVYFGLGAPHALRAGGGFIYTHMHALSLTHTQTQNNLKAHVVALEQQEENLDLIKEVRKEKGDKGENPD